MIERYCVPLSGALAVQGGRVMRFPKGLQQLLVGDHFGIVFDLNDLGVAGVAGANFLVGRILFGAAGIAAGDGLDAGEHLKHRFGAPETAAAQRGDFSVIG